MRFLSVGDTFTGTMHYDSCTRLEDHPAAIIITKSAGNVVAASVVARVRGQTRTWDLKGFFHVGSSRLVLAVDGHDSKDLSVVCQFSNNDDGASCKLVRDNFSTQCGTFDITRDVTGVCSPYLGQRGGGLFQMTVN